MQRIHSQEATRKEAAAVAGPPAEMPPDAATVARLASQEAAAVRTAPAVVQVTVKTTTGLERGTAQLTATPDTPIAEIMERACAELGIRDHARHALVARGEVLGDGNMSLRDLAGEELEDDIQMRLVRKPEAGCRSS